MKNLGLTAKIIKLVNSPFYGFRNQVKSIEPTQGLLGLDLTANKVTEFKDIAADKVLNI